MRFLWWRLPLFHLLTWDLPDMTWFSHNFLRNRLLEDIRWDCSDLHSDWKGSSPNRSKENCGLQNEDMIRLSEEQIRFSADYGVSEMISLHSDHWELHVPRTVFCNGCPRVGSDRGDIRSHVEELMVEDELVVVVEVADGSDDSELLLSSYLQNRKVVMSKEFEVGQTYVSGTSW